VVEDINSKVFGQNNSRLMLNVKNEHLIDKNILSRKVFI